MNPSHIVELIMAQHWDMAACKCWICEAGRAAGLHPLHGDVEQEAADEIERLRAEIERLVEECIAARRKTAEREKRLAIVAERLKKLDDMLATVFPHPVNDAALVILTLRSALAVAEVKDAD